MKGILRGIRSSHRKFVIGVVASVCVAIVCVLTGSKSSFVPKHVSANLDSADSGLFSGLVGSFAVNSNRNLFLGGKVHITSAFDTGGGYHDTDSDSHYITGWDWWNADGIYNGFFEYPINSVITGSAGFGYTSHGTIDDWNALYSDSYNRNTSLGVPSGRNFLDWNTNTWYNSPNFCVSRAYSNYSNSEFDICGITSASFGSWKSNFGVSMGLYAFNPWDWEGLSYEVDSFGAESFPNMVIRENHNPNNISNNGYQWLGKVDDVIPAIQSDNGNINSIDHGDIGTEDFVNYHINPDLHGDNGGLVQGDNHILGVTWDSAGGYLFEEKAFEYDSVAPNLATNIYGMRDGSYSSKKNPANNGWYNNSMYRNNDVVFVGSDATSGMWNCSTKVSCLNNGNYIGGGISSDGTESYSTSLKSIVDALGQGTNKNFNFSMMDNATNTVCIPISMDIDTSIPTVDSFSGNINSDSDGNPVSITYSGAASDYTSGVDLLSLSVSNKSTNKVYSVSPTYISSDADGKMHYSFSYTVPISDFNNAPGSYTATVTAMDKAVNTSDSNDSKVISVVAFSPKITYSPSSQSTWTNASINPVITASVSNATPFSSVTYKVSADGGNTWISSGSFNLGSSWVSGGQEYVSQAINLKGIASSGKFIISTTATTQYGGSTVRTLTVASGTYLLDYVSPSIATPSPSSTNGWTNTSSVNTALNVSDNSNGSGLAIFRYNYVDASSGSAKYSNSWGVSGFSASNTAGLNADGAYKLAVSASDIAGNSSTLSNPGLYLIDTHAPNISVSSSGTGSWVNVMPSITIQATDSQAVTSEISGIDTIKYEWVNNTNQSTSGWQTYTNTNTSGAYFGGKSLSASVVVSPPSDGSWTLKVMSTDVAGNTVSQTYGSYNVDTHKVSVSANPSSYSWTSGSKVITVSLNDSNGANVAVSSIASAKYQWINKSNNATTAWTNKSVTGGQSSLSFSLNVPSDGSWALNLIVMDNAGNETDQTFGTYNLDTHKVSVSASPSSYSWTSSAKTVAISVDDSNGSNVSVSGIANVSYQWINNSNGVANASQNYTGISVGSVSGSFTLTVPDGSWNLRVTVTDVAGNSNTQTFGAFNEDTHGVAISANPSAYGWSSNSASIAVSLNDSNGSNVSVSGISSVTYQWINNANGSANASQSYTGISVGSVSGSFAVSAPGDGSWSLKVTATDVAGNVTSQTFGAYRLDRHGVGISASPSSQSWTSNTVSTVISLSDSNGSNVSVSGISSITYQWINNANGVANTSQSYTGISVGSVSGSFAVSVPGDGSWNLKVTVTDVAGNATSRTFGAFNRDKHSVLISASPTSKSWVNSIVSTTISLSDSNGANVSVSGISSVTYQWINNANGVANASQTYSGISVGSASGSFTISVPSDGSWNLKVTVTDVAGNTTSQTFGSYNQDKHSVVVSASPSSQSWTNSSVSTTVTLNDVNGSNVSVSGISSITYQWINNANGVVGASQSVSGIHSGSITGSFTVSVPGDGSWNLKVTVTDVAGNATSQTFGAFNRDKQKPVVSVSPTSLEWSSNPINVSVSLSDKNGSESTSGISSAKYQWQNTIGNANGNGSSVSYAVQTVSVVKGSSAVSFNTTVPAEGEWQLVVWATDVAGNTNTSTTAPYGYDKTAPTAGASPSSVAWTNQPFSVSLSSSDKSLTVNATSGVKLLSYAWSMSNKVAPTAWHTYTGTLSEPVDIAGFTDTDGEGCWYLWYRVLDNSVPANITTSYYGAYQYDVTKPDIPLIQMSSSTWSTAPVTFSLSNWSDRYPNDVYGSSEVSGVKSVQYQYTELESGYVSPKYTYSTASNPGQTITLSHPVGSLNVTYGWYHVKVWVTDNAGNVSVDEYDTNNPGGNNGSDSNITPPPIPIPYPNQGGQAQSGTLTFVNSSDWMDSGNQNKSYFSTSARWFKSTDTTTLFGSSGITSSQNALQNSIFTGETFEAKYTDPNLTTSASPTVPLQMPLKGYLVLKDVTSGSLQFYPVRFGSVSGSTTGYSNQGSQEVYAYVDSRDFNSNDTFEVGMYVVQYSPANLSPLWVSSTFANPVSYSSVHVASDSGDKLTNWIKGSSSNYSTTGALNNSNTSGLIVEHNTSPLLGNPAVTAVTSNNVVTGIKFGNLDATPTRVKTIEYSVTPQSTGITGAVSSVSVPNYSGVGSITVPLSLLETSTVNYVVVDALGNVTTGSIQISVSGGTSVSVHYDYDWNSNTFSIGSNATGNGSLNGNVFNFLQ